MTKLLSMSLAIVLYGQLLFNALNYYFQIQNPSWPIWIFLYGMAVWITLDNIQKSNTRINAVDVCFVVFVTYAIVSFVAIGESDYQEFYFRITFMCLGPYILGRVLGTRVDYSLYGSLKILASLYLILIVTEVLKNPTLFTDIDRTRIFDVQGQQRTASGYLIGLTMGSMWVAAFAYFTMRRKIPGFVGSTSFTIKLSLLVIPVVIMAVGSRGSVAAVFGTAAILVYLSSVVFSKQGKIGLKTGVGVVSLAIFVGLVSINYLPEHRKVLLYEAYGSLVNQGIYAETCIVDTGYSFVNRIGLLSEAFRLFWESPLFGTGASNYGWNYCGSGADFMSPHSIFIQVLAELGIVGFGMYMLLHISVVQMFLRRMRSQTHSSKMVVWVLFSMWLFLVIQTQISGNMYHDYQFFLLTGLIVSCFIRQNQKDKMISEKGRRVLAN